MYCVTPDDPIIVSKSSPSKTSIVGACINPYSSKLGVSPISPNSSILPLNVTVEDVLFVSGSTSGKLIDAVVTTSGTSTTLGILLIAVSCGTSSSNVTIGNSAFAQVKSAFNKVLSASSIVESAV